MITRFTFVLFVFFNFNNTFAKNDNDFFIPPCRNMDSAELSYKLPILENEFSKNKKLIDDYKLPTLIALSYFPELKDVHISFVKRKINTTMQCRPRILSTFSKKNRRYVILVNDNENFKGILTKHVSFNSQVGLIGHELAHIVDYENSRLKQIIGRAFDYTKDHRKKCFEHEIDSITIARGLGWQLYDFTYFSLNNPISTDEYKAFKRKIYMTPRRILEKIKSLEIYRNLID